METTQLIFTDQIKLPENNMREYIDRDEIFELAEDIKKNGLINPITVRPKNGTFELVAGQRRYLAHQVAGILKIKSIVRELSDDEALAIMTSENLARVEVNPVDEANHIVRLMKANNDDIKVVAGLVSRGENWVKDRIEIGNMPDYLQNFLATKQIKIGVALVLNQITDDGMRKMWVEQAAREGVSIAMAEYWLADFKTRFLPGGSMNVGDGGVNDFTPPSAIMFNCAIDGKPYDVRLMKSIIIAESNLEMFQAFVSAFREPAD